MCPPDSGGTLIITFDHWVGSEPLVNGDKKYFNTQREAYSIDLFKYYISNIEMGGMKLEDESTGYHLINSSLIESQKLSLHISPGTYSSISFLIGVDSLHNVSGAQSGDLDPLNGMFWTWNTGYVMAKLEGHSSSSPNHSKFEYHIGGFEGENNVLHTVRLFFKTPLIIKEGDNVGLLLHVDVN